MVRALGPVLRWIAVAGLVIGVGVGVGLAVINLGLTPPSTGDIPVASPTPGSSSTPTTAPDLALQMPTGDCTACHRTPGETIAVPPIGHPLEGWTSCTSCHANDRLVKTAPGHSGVHAEQCILCHKATTPAAVDRPHSLTKNANCLACHGSLAPLPESMRNRSGTTCWLCQQGSGVQAPAYAHRTPTDGKCLTCHAAGKAGALPADHLSRTDAMCLACHAQAPGAAPTAPHDLASRAGMCTFCHGGSVNQD
jgi:hypothetical protein